MILFIGKSNTHSLQMLDHYRFKHHARKTITVFTGGVKLLVLHDQSYLNPVYKEALALHKGVNQLLVTSSMLGFWLDGEALPTVDSWERFILSPISGVSVVGEDRRGGNEGVNAPGGGIPP